MLWSHILLVPTGFVICCRKDGNAAYSQVHLDNRGSAPPAEVSSVYSVPVRKPQSLIELNVVLIRNDARFQQRDSQLILRRKPRGLPEAKGAMSCDFPSATSGHLQVMGPFLPYGSIHLLPLLC